MITSAMAPDISLFILTIGGLLAGLWVPERYRLVWHRCMIIGLWGIVWLVSQRMPEVSTVWLHGHWVDDSLAAVTKLVVSVSMIMVLYYARPYAVEQQLFKLEWTILHLFTLQGMYVLVSAYSLLTIYLGLQLMALPMYAIVAMSKTGRAVEAAIKYFITGGVASAMLLYGVSLAYGYLGEIGLPALVQHAGSQTEVWWTVIAMIFIIAALFFKLAAAPFHMWAPDVYEGAPWSATLLIATVPKLAVFAVLFRLFVEILPDYQSYWHEWLLAIGVLSITVGNGLAVVQQRIRRLFAYSAVAQIGYGLLALVPGSEMGYAAAVFYLIGYLLAVLAGLGCLVVLNRSACDTVDDLKALNQDQPMLACTLLLSLLSLMGIPPLVGFLGKLLVIQALFDAGYIKVAIYILLMAVIAAYYYLKIIKAIYFEQSPPLKNACLSSTHRYVLMGHGLLCVWFGLFPAGLYLYCQQVVQSF